MNKAKVTLDRCKIPDGRPPSTLDREEAAAQAKLCFSTVMCSFCDVCRLLCPDLCITRDADSGKIVIDLQYCKGCGLCAHYCPKGAIRMVLDRKKSSES